MAKMDKFYWCSTDHKKIIIPNEGTAYSLGGVVYGRDGFKDGTTIQTSTIASINNGIATTKSGTVYELGEMHPDYAEILSSIEAGIPVIKDWKLYGDRRNGYIITGHLLGKDNEKVHGRVTSQDGNFVALDDTRYLVIWRNLVINPMERLDATINGRYCDLRLDSDFEEYLHDNKIRPKLMG